MASRDSWPRVVVLVDMNCFFAAIEQQDKPQWRLKPLAVTNGLLGTTIITSSYEARAFGIKTGMKLKDARQLCPELIQAPSRPHRYTAISTKIMTALQTISPDIEIYSVDEAFLDVTHCQRLHGSPFEIAQLIKQTVYQASGLLCSVGVSGDKTTAKFAAKKKKPDGLTVVPPWQAEAILAGEKVTALSGINKGVAAFLKKYGVSYCGEMKQLPMSVLAKRFGNPGRRFWLMAQGKDPEKVLCNSKPPQTMGHGKNMPPETRDKQLILTYFQHMSEKLARRLRQNNLKASLFFIGIKAQQGWLAARQRHSHATDDGKVIFDLCKKFADSNWQGQGAWQVRVVALDLQPQLQDDLFEDITQQQQRSKVNAATDTINQRFGEFAIAPSRLIDRSDMPNVIAPSWQPTGHRKTV